MKKKIIVSSILAISFVFVTLASAQAAQLVRTSNGGALTTSTVNAALTEKCQILTTKVDTQVAKFNNNKERHSKVFSALTNKISIIINSLDAKGIDTGNLKADLAVLSEKVNKFNSDYQIYVDKLAVTKDYVCGASAGQFVSKVGEARKQLLTIRKDILDINNFYQTTIRPDIKTIRNQIRAMGTSTQLKLNIKGSSTSIVE
ncbi:MAG: hypothetical protein WC244_02110 [Patescibacteria group bacterium]|jgi:hypothetical protein